jgi:hypothetical protein
MKTNILTNAVALSDRDLLAHIDALTRTEREAVAELVAHLTALELRPSLYLAQGYGSLFDYCTRALRLSEDATCSRTNAVRVCRRFPVLLDHLASGALTLTSVRLLGPHLTAENHEAIVARAKDKALREVQALVAELAPRPDVPSSVRKLPVRKAARPCPVSPTPAGSGLGTATLIDTAPNESSSGTGIDHARATEERPGLQALPAALPLQAIVPPRGLDHQRPVVQALAPERYRVQFTIGQEAHDKLRRVQALLRREIPNGDPAAIFDRGLDLLLEKVERARIGAVAKPQRRAAEVQPKGGAYEKRIRFKTDNTRDAPRAGVPSEAVASTQEPLSRPGPNEDGFGRRKGPSRHIPNAIKRAVWRRDAGQCAFVSVTGRRCIERNFLELHHIQPYALDGPATVGNISLRCRQHNRYEAEVVFGPRAVTDTRPG